MNDGNTIVVTGATGKQGYVTARHLLRSGWRVRVTVRDLSAPVAQALAESGAELVYGDFDVADSWPAALRGAYGLFLVPPPAVSSHGWDHDLEFRRANQVINAASDTGVEHLVFTGIGSMSHDWATDRGKRRIESAVAAAPMKTTTLRPVRFMENYLSRHFPLDGINGGVHRHLFPSDHLLQVIAVDDVGAFTALVFGDPDTFDGQAIELAGDADTPVNFAAAISAATGIEVRYEPLGQDAARRLGEDIAETWRILRSGHGWHADIAQVRQRLPKLRDFDSWLQSVGAQRIRSAQQA